MAMGRNIVAAVLMVLMALFWIVFLGGVASLQDACINANDQNQVVIVGRRMLLGADMPARRVLKSTFEECGNQYSFHWWIVFFQLFCMIGMIVCTVSPAAGQRFQHTMTTFMAMETTLLMYAASTVVIPGFNTTGMSDKLIRGLQATSAGTVSLAVLNSVWMLLSTDIYGLLAPEANTFKSAAMTSSSSSSAPVILTTPQHFAMTNMSSPVKASHDHDGGVTATVVASSYPPPYGAQPPRT